MILINQILAVIFFIQYIEAIPLPIILTRWHTAPTSTTTQTYTTGTTTVYLPPVLLFISDGTTYTSTLTDGQWATTPVTTTSYYQDPAPTETLAATTTNTPVDPPAPTTSSSIPPVITVPTTTSTTPTTTSTTPTTTSTTPTTTSTTPTTTSTTPTTTSTTPTTTSTTPTTTSTTPTTTSTTPTTTSTTPTTTSTTPTTTSTTPATTSTTPTTTSTTPTTTQAPTTKPATTSTSSTLTYSSIPSAVATLTPPKYIVYSPYLNDGGCKDVPTMTNDLELIKSRGINYIRIYGSDCNSVPNVLPIAASLGLKVNQGFWFSQYQVDSIDSGVSDLISYGQQYGWDVIDFVTVGNEAINDGFLTVSQLTSKIASVKSLLQAAGYTGQITTAEPPNSFIDNPSLCTQSAIDFVSVNAHSYFDQYAAPSDAGTFVAGQVQLVQNVCGSKNVFVAETGYPSQGATNGLNVPTPENQAIAIQAILSVYGTDITILTTFDDFWKAPGPYGIEQYFGAIQLFS